MGVALKCRFYVALRQLEALLGVIARLVIVRYLHRDLQVFLDAPPRDREDELPPTPRALAPQRDAAIL